MELHQAAVPITDPLQPRKNPPGNGTTTTRSSSAQDRPVYTRPSTTTSQSRPTYSGTFQRHIKIFGIINIQQAQFVRIISYSRPSSSGSSSYSRPSSSGSSSYSRPSSSSSYSGGSRSSGSSSGILFRWQQIVRWWFILLRWRWFQVRRRIIRVQRIKKITSYCPG